MREQVQAVALGVEAGEQLQILLETRLLAAERHGRRFRVGTLDRDRRAKGCRPSLMRSANVILPLTMNVSGITGRVRSQRSG